MASVAIDESAAEEVLVRRPLSTSMIDLPAFLELVARVAAHTTYTSPELRDPEQLSRFLKARNLNVDAAFVMWEKWAAWFLDFRPTHIRLEEVTPILERGTMRASGHDKAGRGVAYVRLGFHEPNARLAQAAMRAAVYCIEEAVRLSYANGAGGYITVIWDHSGCNMGNFDAALLTGKDGLIKVLQDCYPERLACLHVIRPDWVFKTLWGVVRPFLDDRTKHKVLVAASPSDLRPLIDEEQLLPEYRSLVFGDNAASP